MTDPCPHEAALAAERDAHEQTRRRLIREQARHRETAEALDWAEEYTRVLKRVIERLGSKD